jgi:hypothetical protein
VYEIGLLDMDYKTLITVMYQTTNGIMTMNRRSVLILIDDSYQVLPINTANVKSIILKFTRSSAVSSFSFCVPSTHMRALCQLIHQFLLLCSL